MTTRKSAVGERKTATDPMYRRSAEPVDVAPVDDDKAGKEKRTFHLDMDIVVLLTDLQAARLRSTGKKPKLSELVGEGIRLLAENQASSSAVGQQPAD